MKQKILAILLALVCALSLTGCTVRETTQLVEKSVSTLQQIADAALDERADAPASGDQFVTAENPEDEQMMPAEMEILPSETDADETNDSIDEYGYYYDVEHVVLYLDTYGHLPDNYITKSEARDLGWEGGSVEAYRDGAAIGGDRFGNREGLLPEAAGRSYTECDIDTDGASARGAKRLIFSNDGLYFYTSDHYESFTELTVDGGTVVWMN